MKLTPRFSHPRCAYCHDHAGAMDSCEDCGASVHTECLHENEFKCPACGRQQSGRWRDQTFTRSSLPIVHKNYAFRPLQEIRRQILDPDSEYNQAVRQEEENQYKELRNNIVIGCLWLVILLLLTFGSHVIK